MLQKFDPDKGRFDVVIIGAGITGLTAAIQIAEQSSKKILILEGADTVGGRARTVKLDNGMKVDAGAHWFHGGDDNPFFQWASKRHSLGHLAMDDTSGRLTVWDRPDPENTLRKAFNKLDARYEAFAKKHPDGDISLHDLARKSGRDEREAAEFMATEWMAMDSSEQISCKEYFNDPLGPGGWQIKGGMNRLIHQMAAEARGRGVQIRCGEQVSDIQDCSGNVYIALKSGESVFAGDCLVTVSAGVLKDQLISFEARVDKTARDSVRGVSMGNLTKIILPMREAFFEERGIKPDTRVYMISDGFFVHARSAGEPVITLFRGGSPSHELEGMKQKKLEKLVGKVLSQVDGFEDYAAYRDGRITTTSWYSDKLTQGSYSIGKPHRDRTDPFACGPIKFAGEAFVASPLESPGQMPAAWHSANKIVPALL